jgi:hypothetical protein
MVMKYPTSSNIRIEFNCGTAAGKVYIDNVSLIPIDSTSVFVFKPSTGDILKDGSKFTIQWVALGVPKVNLEYSADSCVTWDTLAQNIDNQGTYSWLVPNKSSENCFIRLKNASKDSILGISSRFIINKFGVTVKAGELITNGNFQKNSQGLMSGWTTSLKGGKGQAAVSSDGMYELSITDPGSSMDAIILSQDGGLPMLGGKEYSLSFDAFANGNRSMAVKLIAEGDSLPLFDSTVVLPAVKGELSFKMTAAADALVKLVFCMGGSRASIFMDNVSFYTGPKPMATGAFKPALFPRADAMFIIKPSGKKVGFFIGNASHAVIDIYDLQGSLVRNLSSVTRSILWDGMTMNGAAVSRGTYIAVLHSNAIRTARRFTMK